MGLRRTSDLPKARLWSPCWCTIRKPLEWVVVQTADKAVVCLTIFAYVNVSLLADFIPYANHANIFSFSELHLYVKRPVFSCLLALNAIYWKSANSLSYFCWQIFWNKCICTTMHWFWHNMDEIRRCYVNQCWQFYLFDIIMPTKCIDSIGAQALSTV